MIFSCPLEVNNSLISFNHLPILICKYWKVVETNIILQCNVSPRVVFSLIPLQRLINHHEIFIFLTSQMGKLMSNGFMLIF